MAKQSTVLAAVKKAVSARKTEQGELGGIAHVLAQHGWSGRPKVLTSKDSHGASIRIYHFESTPAGEFVLITGPSIEGKVVTMAEMNKTPAPDGFYVETVPSDSAVAKRAADKFAALDAKAKKMAKGPSKTAATRKKAAPKKAEAPKKRKLTGRSTDWSRKEITSYGDRSSLRPKKAKPAFAKAPQIKRATYKHGGLMTREAYKERQASKSKSGKTDDELMADMQATLAATLKSLGIG